MVPGSPEAPAAPIVRIGIDTAAMGRNYPTDLALVGDAKATLADLNTALDSLLIDARRKAMASARSEEVRALTKGRAAPASDHRARRNAGRPEWGEVSGWHMTCVCARPDIWDEVQRAVNEHLLIALRRRSESFAKHCLTKRGIP